MNSNNLEDTLDSLSPFPHEVSSSFHILKIVIFKILSVDYITREES